MPTSKTQLRKLALAGQRRKARPRPGALARPPQPDADPLSTVAFGSKGAREKAEEEPALTWRDFAASTVVPSGEKGYLVEDVKEVREQRDKIPEGEE